MEKTYTFPGIPNEQFKLVTIPSIRICAEVEKLTGLPLLSGKNVEDVGMDAKALAEATRLMLVGNTKTITEDTITPEEFNEVLGDFLSLRKAMAKNSGQFKSPSAS